MINFRRLGGGASLLAGACAIDLQVYFANLFIGQAIGEFHCDRFMDRVFNRVTILR